MDTMMEEMNRNWLRETAQRRLEVLGLVALAVSFAACNAETPREKPPLLELVFPASPATTTFFHELGVEVTKWTSDPLPNPNFSEGVFRVHALGLSSTAELSVEIRLAVDFATGGSATSPANIKDASVRITRPDTHLSLDQMQSSLRLFITDLGDYEKAIRGAAHQNDGPACPCTPSLECTLAQVKCESMRSVCISRLVDEAAAWLAATVCAAATGPGDPACWALAAIAAAIGADAIRVCGEADAACAEVDPACFPYLMCLQCCIFSGADPSTCH